MVFSGSITPTVFSPLSIGDDIFVEVSHGPTLIDNNVMLSSNCVRLSTQGVAIVHNLIAGAFIGVGIGTDNGGIKFPTPRYTPYHVPHRTEIAGFMTFLHGDMRFYNNIFIQRPVRKDFLAYAKVLLDEQVIAEMPNFVTGTKPYDGYPTAKAYFNGLTQPDAFGMYSGDKYYDHLPVSTGGNVFLDGAQPCNIEENFAIAEAPVFLQLEERSEGYVLNTNLYQILRELSTPFVSTELLGEAFEPEQKFECPDGTPILFDRDYFEERHGLHPTPGPFADGCELEHPLVSSR